MEIRFPFQFVNGSALADRNVNVLAYQHLYAMLATWKGERVMMPTYGGPFREVLFDPADEATVTHLIRLIQDASLGWNRDVEITQINRVMPDTSPDKNATIMLDVHYRAVQTGAVGKTQVWTDGVSLREV